MSEHQKKSLEKILELIHWTIILLIFILANVHG